MAESDNRDSGAAPAGAERMTIHTPGNHAGLAPAPGSLIKGQQDFAAGLLLVGLALAALWASSDLRLGTLRAMGPGMLPVSVAVMVGLAGVALVVASMTASGPALERWSWRGPAFVTLAILAFAMTVRTFGLAVAGPLCVVLSGFAGTDTRWKELAVFAVVMTALCIGLFRYLLNLPIPVLILPGLRI
jgi:putative tricarboxylic transport membrane protein